MKNLKLMALVVLVCYGQSMLAMSISGEEIDKAVMKMEADTLKAEINALNGIKINDVKMQEDDEGNPVLNFIIGNSPDAPRMWGTARYYISLLNQLRALKASNPDFYNRYVAAIETSRSQDTSFPANIQNAEELKQYPMLVIFEGNSAPGSVINHIVTMNMPR